MAIDPVTLAVVQNGLKQVVTEMDTTFERAAFNQILSEARDRCDGIFEKDTGEMVAQGDIALPLFIGSLQACTQHVIRETTFAPGDIVILNDPYRGGTHLMDVRLVKPFYYRDELFSILANVGHWPDVGGMVAGGYASGATEIQQEGLRLPPVKLYDRGRLNQDIVEIIMHNLRVPEERIGDLRAQIAAINVGEKRLTALLDKYGADVVAACMTELKARAEKMMRRFIADIPDGVYRGETWLDSDGIDNEPLRVVANMTVAGSDLIFDFSESSPPCRGPVNGVLGTTVASVYIALKHVFPDMPINAGWQKPIHVNIPDTTFLNASYPRPVSGCASEVSQKVIVAVFEAMAQAIPERLWGAPAGSSFNFTLSGYDDRKKQRYVMYQIAGGGHGGSRGNDGLTNGAAPISMSPTTPMEILERNYPLIVEEHALRENSEGAGMHRGGFGVRFRARVLAETASASCMMDRGRFAPQGVLGGGESVCTRVVFNQGGKEFIPPHLTKVTDVQLKRGDGWIVETPGGGGYGSPASRDPAAVLDDWIQERISIERARDVYGVVIDAQAKRVDEAATAALRRQLDPGQGARAPALEPAVG